LSTGTGLKYGNCTWILVLGWSMVTVYKGISKIQNTHKGTGPNKVPKWLSITIIKHYKKPNKISRSEFGKWKVPKSFILKRVINLEMEKKYWKGHKLGLYLEMNWRTTRLHLNTGFKTTLVLDYPVKTWKRDDKNLILYLKKSLKPRIYTSNWVLQAILIQIV
jgi:hypothetical protein